MNEELSKLIALLEEPEFHGLNTRRYNENIQLILKSVIGTQLEVICCNLFHSLRVNYDIRRFYIIYKSNVKIEI